MELSGKAILKASIVQMAFNTAAVGLGFVREMLLANYFGASEATDAYLVAYALPFMLYTVMTTALPLVLVPALEQAGPRTPAGRRLLSGILTAQILGLGAVAGLMAAAAPAIIHLQAPGLPQSTASQAAFLLQIMLPIIVILPVAWTICGLCFALKEFTLPALGKVLFAGVGVAALFGFAVRVGIATAATGVLVAAILQLALMVPVMLRHRVRLFSWSAVRDPATRRLLMATLVMIPIQANLYIYLVVDRFLASGLPAGTISILNYGDKVVKALAGITTLALGVVIFSYLAEAAASGDRARLDATTSFALRLMMIILLPLQVGVTVLGAPLIQLLFQRGAFDAADAAGTTLAMNLQIASLFAVGFSLVMYRVLFALQNYKLALILSTGIVALNITLKAILVRPLGFRAMPLAMSVTAIIEAVALGWALREWLPCLRSRALWGEVAKVLGASLAMGALLLWGHVALPRAAAVGHAAWAQLLVLAPMGALVYVGLLRLLRVSGVAALWGSLTAALGRHPVSGEIAE